MIQLGYACQSLGLGISASRTITLTNFNKLTEIDKIKTLNALYTKNLEELLDILEYNVKSGIFVFRITSKLFPISNLRLDIFDTYVKENAWLFDKIRSYIKENNMRISFHPDQFLVINTPHRDVFYNTITDLRLHAQACYLLGIADKPCIVLHVGGKYNSKENSLQRFKNSWSTISIDIQALVMLENDDKSYDLDDTLHLCQDLYLPMVLDVHHAWCTLYKPFDYTGADGLIDYSFITEEQLNDVKDTWSGLTPKFHFSSRASDTSFRSHSSFINTNDFISFIDKVNYDVDIMLECKSKDMALNKLKSDILLLRGTDALL